MNLTHLHRHHATKTTTLMGSKCTPLPQWVFLQCFITSYHLFNIVLGIRQGLENGQVRHWWTSRAPQQVVILSVHQLNDGRLWIRWSDSALITNWGKLLKDQQTHWTKISVQEGAITPASGQPCSCQANLCEGVHPLYVRHIWFLRQNVPKWQQGKKSR